MQRHPSDHRNHVCDKFPDVLRAETRDEFLCLRDFEELGGIDIYYKCNPHIGLRQCLSFRTQYTEKAVQLGWLSSLYSVGRSLLNHAINRLAMVELIPLHEFEDGKSDLS